MVYLIFCPSFTSFPFGRQYKYEDFDSLFAEYGFKNKIPASLLAIHNGEYEDLVRYQDIASFMKEIEMDPPDEVVKLNLKFEGNSNDGTDS